MMKPCINQLLTTNKGPIYIAITGNNPYFKINKKILSNVKVTPISDIQTFLDHIDGHNALENGLIGQK